ncbi:hypothetical protein FOQG_17867 [Fusarium oxysporum f. sp. raphani 54005]|uniref:Uncharacterized protein n=1 Tax=Fusarium oxysporum f. sp. raphani 54005 TaxID=1089458 RepID=X0BF07_FUSOX|nr:hypothetical protein FOQG_17867 [Fusarium oxysporum f. sp. raphani 54005]
MGKIYASVTLLRKRCCYASPSHATDHRQDWADFVC